LRDQKNLLVQVTIGMLADLWSMYFHGYSTMLPSSVASCQRRLVKASHLLRTCLFFCWRHSHRLYRCRKDVPVIVCPMDFEAPLARKSFCCAAMGLNFGHVPVAGLCPLMPPAAPAHPEFVLWMDGREAVWASCSAISSSPLAWSIAAAF